MRWYKRCSAWLAQNTSGARLLTAGALALALLAPASASALPKNSRVAGGVALVELGTASPPGTRPRAWFGEREVLVSAAVGQWVAVVGLALDLAPGDYTLRVEQEGKTSAHEFTVKDKRYPEQHITLRDASKVQLSAVDEARAEKEIAQIQQLKRHWRDTAATDSDLELPARGRLASRFGLRRFFNGEPRAAHSGLDVAVARGTPIAASAAGQVLAIGDYFFNGKTVFVDHGNGLITMYCHLDSIIVAAGEKVRGGQRLGLSGMTGRASGPHVHWSVVLNGAMVDPELFISAAQAVRKGTARR